MNIYSFIRKINSNATKLANECVTFRTREVNRSDRRYLDSPIENAFNYVMVVGRKNRKDLYWSNVRPKDIGLTDSSITNSSADVYFIGKDGESNLLMLNGGFHAGKTLAETKSKAAAFCETVGNLRDMYAINGKIIVVLHDRQWRFIRDNKGKIIPMSTIINLYDMPGVIVYDCTEYSDEIFCYSTKNVRSIEAYKRALNALKEVFSLVINDVMGKDLNIESSLLEMAKADYYNYITIRDMQYRNRSAIKAILRAKPADIGTKKRAINYFKSLDINPIQGFIAGGISNFESMWKYVDDNGIILSNIDNAITKIAAKRSGKKPGRIK